MMKTFWNMRARTAPTIPPKATASPVDSMSKILKKYATASMTLNVEEIPKAHPAQQMAIWSLSNVPHRSVRHATHKQVVTEWQVRRRNLQHEHNQTEYNTSRDRTTQHICIALALTGIGLIKDVVTGMI